jgi:hypothetical protein
MNNPTRHENPAIHDSPPRPRFGRWVLFDRLNRFYPLETNDFNVVKVFQRWNARHVWVPTKWLDNKRLVSKLRNKPCDRYLGLMIAQCLPTTWREEQAIPKVFMQFVRAYQSGSMDFSQLYASSSIEFNVS